MTLELGKKYWTIANSIESESCDSDLPPNKPHLIIVTRPNIGSSFSDNDVPDIDSNASYYLNERNTFGSFEDAADAFNEHTETYIKQKKEELEYLKRWKNEVLAMTKKSK